MSKFELGDPVELSATGLRYLNGRHRKGWVIAINKLPAIKVKFEGSEQPAEWWTPSWFIIRSGQKLTGY